MKKFCKFVLGTVSLVTLACGGFYFFKKYIGKETQDDFDDFDDEAEDFETEDTAANAPESRGYVSINLSSDNTANTEESNEDSASDAEEKDSEKENTEKDHSSDLEEITHSSEEQNF